MEYKATNQNRIAVFELNRNFSEKLLNSLTVDDADQVCGCVFINPSQKGIVICGRATPRFDTWHTSSCGS